MLWPVTSSGGRIEIGGQLNLRANVQVKSMKKCYDFFHLLALLQIEGLPTIVFIPKEGGKPALRTEGLLPAQQIMDIVAEL